MEKLWYKAAMIFAFSMTVVAAGYFLTGLNDQLAQQVQSGAVDNMSVVVLDAGHGGMDGGATAGNIRESDINLSIAEKTRTMLTLLGYRVDASRSSSGFGIGLSLAHSIAEGHKGSIRATCREDGEIEFTVSLGKCV